MSFEEGAMLAKFVRSVLVLVGAALMGSVMMAQTTNTNCTATSAGPNTTDVNCTSNTTTYGPTPAQAAVQVEQQKELNDNMAKTGAALGNLIAMKRAQHAQEKSDLVAVVYCRQNPTGSWTFSEKSPTPCPTLEKNLAAYCTVNSKNHLCKDIAKLAPPASVPIVAEVRPAQAQQPVAQQTPVVAQPVQAVVPQPAPQPIPVASASVASQPQVQQMVTVSTTVPPAEISVAEAARRNRAAKQAQQASENPQAQLPGAQPQP
jgi:hypothetical protein